MAEESARERWKAWEEASGYEREKSGALKKWAARKIGAPAFKDYAEAQSWIESRAKAHGSKDKFLSSDEYREALPRIRQLHAQVSKSHSDEGEKAMAEKGHRYGDRVRYSVAGLWGDTLTLTGVLKRSKRGPRVKLDRPVEGKKSIGWHRGFTKD